MTCSAPHASRSRYAEHLRVCAELGRRAGVDASRVDAYFRGDDVPPGVAAAIEKLRGEPQSAAHLFRDFPRP